MRSRSVLVLSSSSLEICLITVSIPLPKPPEKPELGRKRKLKLKNNARIIASNIKLRISQTIIFANSGNFTFELRIIFRTVDEHISDRPNSFDEFGVFEVVTEFFSK